jgi:hypothetical protein
MKTRLIFYCLLVALGSTQSISSQTLHPLYKDKTDEVFEPALLGTWVSCAGTAFPICVGLQFEKSPDVGYRVTEPVSESPNVDLVFAFHLVRLGDVLFGDLKLMDIVVAGQSLKIDLGSQSHRILKVSLRGSKLTTSGVVFSLEETKKAVGGSGIQLHLETLDDGSLLSLSSTTDLQEFARKMANDKRIFSDDHEWERPEKGEK